MLLGHRDAHETLTGPQTPFDGVLRYPSAYAMRSRPVLVEQVGGEGVEPDQRRQFGDLVSAVESEDRT